MAKVVILGGAGVRVPLLTNGFLQFSRELPVEELVLWDVNRPRLEMIARISRAMVHSRNAGLTISTPERLEEALSDATYVISSIRIGGMQGRILDETIAMKHGTLGQETVGAGGFALALRTIPVLLDYARKVAEWAPDAWLLNFTNPVGIVSQAMLEAGVGDRTIGICDTPREHFEGLAHAIGVPMEQAFFDYLGLNHAGWVRGVHVDGRDRMPEILGDVEKLSQVYRRPLFPAQRIRDLGLFPTEYLYYYYSPEEAREQTRSSDHTRGQQIADLDRELTARAQPENAGPDDLVRAYEDYLAGRNATYMSVETGEAVDEEKLSVAREELYNSTTGYDRIALDVMVAMHNDRPTVIPVDVANRGAIIDFRDNDAIEVPCLIDSNGARPLAAGRLPESVRELALQLKEYERLTVDAALQASRSLAVDALAANPIMTSRDQARHILDDFVMAHQPHLDYLND